MAMPAGEIRSSQRSAWNGLAPAWDKWDEPIMRQLQPVTDAMVERLDLAPDARHLDVASGTGEPGISIAAQCPRGRAMLTDLAPDMLAVAERRAAARGITNVDTRVAGAEALPFPDAAFDSASVRFGFMFVPDPAAAATEIARVLKPGGRICAAVWAEPDRNPWTTIAVGAVATEVPVPAAAPGAPHMYRFAEPGSLSAVLEAAGLHDVREWEVPVMLTVGSADEYWAMMSEHVSVVAHALQASDEMGRRRIRDQAIAAVAPFGREGQLAIPGMARSVIATARGVAL